MVHSGVRRRGGRRRIDQYWRYHHGACLHRRWPAVPDPDPNLSVQEVRAQFAEFFPELVNADAREEAKGDDTLITFTKRIGTKGTANAVPRPQRAGPPPAPRPRHRRNLAARAREAFGRLRPGAPLGGPDGTLDLDAAGRHEPAIALARAEAQAYARATQRAVVALRRLPAR